MAMYDYLGIKYHWQKFRFEFSKGECSNAESGKGLGSRPYFIHASDKHEMPPPRPATMSRLAYVLELVFVVVCFAWYTFCSSLIPASEHSETLETYLKRIWMPRQFVSRYLLPLMSAVATCTHQEMLEFPASDVVRYRKVITRRKQYVVCGGVCTVQNTLTQGMDIKTRMKVVRVEPKTSGVEVVAEILNEEGRIQRVSQVFDQVITAVPPNVAAGIFEPAWKQLARIPVRILETIVHPVQVETSHGRAEGQADCVLLNTSDDAGGWTQATQVHQCGVAVTSCPLPNSTVREILSRSVFTRTLRTPESREIVQRAFDHEHSWSANRSELETWRNGECGVWMVGAWCWDGMVLLEGAVVSAMRVAKALDVEIPW